MESPAGMWSEIFFSLSCEAANILIIKKAAIAAFLIPTLNFELCSLKI